MDSLSQELLELILEQLAEYEFPITARFPVLDDASRQAILDARLVRHCFRDSAALTRLFVAVLEDTPFLWHGNQMPRLGEVAASKYAATMTTLSLSGMNLKKWYEYSSMMTAPMNLTAVLRRFVRVKHIRYYPMSPKCFKMDFPIGKFRGGLGPRAQNGYPEDDDRINSWLERQQEEGAFRFDNTMFGINNAGLALDSVTFPMFGNRASYCSMELTTDIFPVALKRLSISLTYRFHDTAIFEPWLKTLKNLTFLEIAISRNPGSLGTWNSFTNCRPLTTKVEPTENDQFPRLEELRLMSDNQNCFSESELLMGLELFPNLRKLGLAHILIRSQNNNRDSWRSFVKRLIPKDLKRLWLLDPRDLRIEVIVGHRNNYAMSKYWGDESYRAAADEVRLIDTESLWMQNTEPQKRRDFEYPGFAIFDQV